MCYYITKKDISQQLKYKNIQIPYILAPMGSGKTTAISEFIASLEPSNRVLILSPYIISNNEYKERIKTDIVKNCVINYYTNICLELNNQAINDMKLKGLIDFYLYGDILIKKIDNYLNSFDYVFLDELDFVAIQGVMNSKVNLFDSELNDYGQHGFINMFHLLVIFLKRLALKRDIYRLAISANKISIPPKINGYTDVIIEKASSINDKNDEYIRFIEFNGKKYREIKSKINITNIVRVEPKCDKKNTKDSYGIKHTSILVALGSILNDSLENNIPTIIFKSKGYDKREAKLLMKYNSYVIQRYENVFKNFNINKKDIDSVFRGYNNFHFIGSNEGILSNEIIKNNKIIAINTSSSRAVSIDGLKGKKARVIILEQNVTTTVTQVIGRFRDANIEVYFLNLNKRIKDIKATITRKDIFLLKHLKPVIDEFDKVCKLKGMYIKKINTTLESRKGFYKGKSIGKNISEKTLNKKKYSKEFIDGIDLNKFKSKLSIYKEYLEYLKVKGLEEFAESRNTFYKKIR